MMFLFRVLLLNLILITLIFQSFGQKKQIENSGDDTKDTFPRPGIIIGYKYFEKKSITGDFNGDGQKDTLTLHNYSTVLQKALDSFPVYEDFYEVQPWLNERDVFLYLTTGKGQDSLIAGRLALDLYTLINIGDINEDGNDEVALSLDYADFSNMNSCKIYSKCESRWKEVYTFYIHEFAYDYDSVADVTIPTDKIPGHLENINGRWHYLDYLVNEQEEDTALYGKLQPLRVVKKCE